MLLTPDQLPRTIFERVFPLGWSGVVMLLDTAIQVVGLADVKPPVLVFEDVYPKNLSGFAQAPRLGLEPRT